MSGTPPTFAVVGHPNKGKSSIVAALAQDDRVRISPVPGTTTRGHRYPMRADGETLYVLIDTPGFQRARQVLAWIRQHAGSAAERPGAVHQFIATHRTGDKFRDECELLTPIIAGAGILYVVDGARPFGIEYQAEMEILRWTGQPSMALINRIGDGDYLPEWRTALAQYFRIVREFNAFTSEFAKRLELLQAFGQLNDDWREPLARAVETLQADRASRRQRSARVIADMLIAMLTLRLTQRIDLEADPQPTQARLRSRYRRRLERLERRCRQRINALYDHACLAHEETTLPVLEQGLFADRTWQLFGLNRSQLLASGAAGGAALGSGIDLATGGASLLLGAGLGAVLGGAATLVSSGRLARVRILGLPLGRQELRVGPIPDRNFPYVVLGRALLHHTLVATRSHARRESLRVDASEAPSGIQTLTPALRRRLERAFDRLRRADTAPTTELHDTLGVLVSEALDGVADA